ncbi:MAG TPA: translation initiation factor IF-2 [Anaerohalosphaeraceae bacterium]|nr:translation initiation factor IF-2 [Anaerohalosphaeraceae bacterium]HRT51678.1 translation initiation factor IF-2 [Anaerohalosphaeraceae bacterium]HRT87363.1 translation initiation factor IF-2 [Anaerohalosphaeraceae bacterium]
MAKATTRVHLLAKELCVTSKAIVEKCQAEGLDVTNHMSTISAGLAATIREWFSEGEHTTAVETAKRVDLKKVRVRRKAKEPAEEAPEQQPAPAEAASEAAETTVETAAPETAPAAAAEAPAETPVAEAPAAETAAAEQPVAAEAAAPAAPEIPAEPEPVTEAQAAATPEVVPPTAPPKPEPEPIKPAGPMLEKPKPAQLTGPRVVRVESVEPQELQPRRRGPVRPSRPRFDMPISEPLIPEGVDVGGKKGKGRDRTRGRRKDLDEGDGDLRRGRAGLGKRVQARDFEERAARLAAARGESLRSRPARRIESKKTLDVSQLERPEKATVTEPITVKDLSAALMVKASDIIAKLLTQGIIAHANQVISPDVAELIAMEFGTELTIERKQLLQEQLLAEFQNLPRHNIRKRPPVVTMLGHVDHGKTSLLDRIRSTSVAAGEAGGITQHIGASVVECKGKVVTFLDTPGHEAFTAMRARGANMTDIVVLVVAADDGVMPQTIEAIHHAKAANVEILVALNKIDLPGVDINRIYGQLAEHGLTPSEWGGDTEIVKTSAVTGQGIEDLIEHLDYIAELRDYKADCEIPATGWVVEAKMTTTQGAVATLLIKEGKLSKGDIILAGSGYGRVRTLRDSRGKSIKSATSSMAVEVSGLSEAPQAGDRFFCTDDLNKAKDAAEENKARSRERSLAQRSQITLDNLFSQIEAGNIKELNLIVKADVQGSVDVLTKYLTDLSTEEVKIKIIHAAVGGINEGDVVLAEASGAIIIGFNVVADDRVREISETKGVDIRFYNIIYRITEDLRDAMTGLLEPTYEEKHLGKLIVRETFKVSSLGTIAGCYVDSGIIQKKAKLRLIRNNIVIKDNCTIESLRHFTDDVREVKAGLECGVKIAGFDAIKRDDVLEAYEIIEVARTL